MWRLPLLVVFAVLFASAGVLAHGYKKGDLNIRHPWTRATPGGATVGVGYLKITNTGATADRLTGGTFEGAERVEIHEMKMEGEMMTMRSLPDGLEIKPGETIVLKPSSFHLMLIGLKQPIVPGPNIKGTLLFEKAGTIDVEYEVQAIGDSKSSDHH